MFWTLRLRSFWRGEGGGREVLSVAYPLILSQMSFTVQVFVDRLCLTWFGPEAVAGAVTGLFVTWALIGLFIGTGEYLTTFVAQDLGAGADPAAFGEVGRTTALLLRFVALYSTFDMTNVVFAAGLRGAGDTTYPLMATLALGWVAMLVPAWLVVAGGGNVYAAWAAPTVYVVLLGSLMLRRFRAGRWKGLRVIEPAVAT